jgi:hypothetical protein
MSNDSTAPVIDERTCLILGAGASVPYGLPTANELRDLIVSSRSGKAGQDVARKFPVKRSTFKRTEMSDFPTTDWVGYLTKVTEAEQLSHQIPEFWNKFSRADQTIDWFLRDNEAAFGDIARLQIAAVLLNCEQNSPSG